MVPLAPRCGEQTACVLLMASLSLAPSLKRSLLRSNVLILTGYLKSQGFEEGTKKLIAGLGWRDGAHHECTGEHRPFQSRALACLGFGAKAAFDEWLLLAEAV